MTKVNYRAHGLGKCCNTGREDPENITITSYKIFFFIHSLKNFIYMVVFFFFLIKEIHEQQVLLTKDFSNTITDQEIRKLFKTTVFKQ